MTASTLTAIAFALLAALFYALAAVFQQEEAAAAPTDMAMRPSLLWRLVRNRRWLLGFACDWGAYGAEAVALGFGAIVVVAPLMQTGLVFALFVNARRTGRHLAPPDWIAVVSLVAGLALFLTLANPSGGIDQPAWADWWPWLAALGALLLGSLAVGRLAHDASRAVAWGLAAAICYGVTGPLTKTAVGLLTSGSPLTMFTSWEVYALVGCAAFGMLCNQSAFQAGNLPASLPVIAIGTPVIGGIIGVAVYQEHLAAQNVVRVILIGLAVATMIIGVFVLARREGRRSEAESVAPA